MKVMNLVLRNQNYTKQYAKHQNPKDIYAAQLIAEGSIDDTLFIRNYFRI